MAEDEQASAEHIGDDTAQFVADVCAEFLILLGCATTRVEVQTDPSGDDCFAAIEAHSQKHLMKLWVCQEWESRDWRANGMTLLHECIHYMHRGPDVILREEVDGRLNNKGWWYSARDIWYREYEMFVDQLTTVLWEHMKIEDRLGQLHKKTKYAKVRHA